MAGKPLLPILCGRVYFRHRFGEEGIAKLFAPSVAIYANKVRKAREVMVTTTVQEKNITFPTDAKLYKKVVKTCNALAKRCGIKCGKAIGLSYNASHMPNVMPTSLDMLKKSNEL